VQLVRTDDRGAVAILVAVLAVTLFVFAGIVVDLGYARNVKLDGQDTADAAALAGAGNLNNCRSFSTCRAAVRAVKKSANENVAGGGPVNWGACSAPAPTLPAGYTWATRGSRTSCIQFGSLPPSTTASVVFVQLPSQRSPVFFGGLVGYKGIDVSASTVAGTNPTQGNPCALCVRGQLTSDSEVQVSGGGSLYARDADASDGSVDVLPGSIYVTNDPQGNNFSPDPRRTNANVPDPLSTRRPLPTVVPLPGSPPTSCDAVTPLDPDSYGDLDVPAACTMNPGVYQFTGDVRIETAGSLTQNGPVTIVLTGSAKLRVDGAVDLGPGLSDPSAFALYAPSGNPSIEVTSGGSLSLAGAVYAPGSDVRSAGAVTIAGTTVLNSLDVTGSTFAVAGPGDPVGSQFGPPESALVR
jgi:Putative Flp pilus-assembly TadE/G-like